MNALNIIKTLFALAVGLLASCSGGSDTQTPQAKRISEVDIPQYEGSRSKPIQTTIEKKLGTKEVHPDVKEGVNINRGIVIPKAVEGQWKAIKIMVRNKLDESRNSMKIVSLGGSFELERSTTVSYTHLTLPTKA